MDRERVCLWIAGDQRIGAQGLDGSVKLERPGDDRFEQRAQMLSAFGEKFFRDRIRGQEGAEAQQFGSSGIFFLDTLERKAPGCCYGFGMFSAPALGKQVGAALAE